MVKELRMDGNTLKLESVCVTVKEKQDKAVFTVLIFMSPYSCCPLTTDLKAAESKKSNKCSLINPTNIGLTSTMGYILLDYGALNTNKVSSLFSL